MDIDCVGMFSPFDSAMSHFVYQVFAATLDCTSFSLDPLQTVGDRLATQVCAECGLRIPLSPSPRYHSRAEVVFPCSELSDVLSECSDNTSFQQTASKSSSAE